MFRLSPGIVVGLMTTSCAIRGKLYPATGAELIKKDDGETVGAKIESAGVAIEVRPNAWVGVPARLRRVTPLLITIENKNTDRIRLRYEEFILQAADGRTFKALPPFHIRGAQNEVDPFAFSAQGWLIPPYRFGVYPWYPIGPGLYPFAGGLFPPNWAAGIRQHRLPTGDMIAKALPESVIEPQGKLTGYLYFENVTKRIDKVDFVAEVVSVPQREKIGTVRIPFRVR